MMALLHSCYLHRLVCGPQSGPALLLPISEWLFPAVVISLLVNSSHSLKVGGLTFPVSL